MLEKKITGFTLVEMIVVIIILGVLALVVVPPLMAQIEKNRGQEAINEMTMMRSAIESCLLQNGNDSTQCTTWDSINMSAPTGRFTYQNPPITSGSNGSWSILATSTSGTIIMSKASDGTMSCTPTGAYAGIC